MNAADRRKYRRGHQAEVPATSSAEALQVTIAPVGMAFRVEVGTFVNGGIEWAQEPGHHLTWDGACKARDALPVVQARTRIVLREL